MCWGASRPRPARPQPQHRPPLLCTPQICGRGHSAGSRPRIPTTTAWSSRGTFSGRLVGTQGTLGLHAAAPGRGLLRCQPKPVIQEGSRPLHHTRWPPAPRRPRPARALSSGHGARVARRWSAFGARRKLTRGPEVVAQGGGEGGSKQVQCRPKEQVCPSAGDDMTIGNTGTLFNRYWYERMSS